MSHRVRMHAEGRASAERMLEEYPVGARVIVTTWKDAPGVVAGHTRYKVSVRLDDYGGQTILTYPMHLDRVVSQDVEAS